MIVDDVPEGMLYGQCPPPGNADLKAWHLRLPEEITEQGMPDNPDHLKAHFHHQCHHQKREAMQGLAFLCAPKAHGQALPPTEA